jgi:hypothetical protein
MGIRRSPRTAAWMVTCIVVLGCGNRERATAPLSDGGVGDADTSVPDGFVPPPPETTASCGGDLTVAHRLAGLGYQHGLLQPDTRRVLSFPDQLSSSLGAIGVLTLTDEGGTISSVAVTGDVPEGRVYGATYQATLDRFIVLTWSRTPEPHYGLASVELTASEARFVTYDLVNAIPSDGFQIQEIHQLSGPRIAMLRGIDTLYQVTIDGTTATFSAPIPVDTTNLPSVVVADPDGDRLLGYGLSYDPATGSEAFLPRVATLSLETGGAWVELPASGDGPTPLYGDDAAFLYQPFTVHDPSADKLFVVHGRWDTDPFFEGERFFNALLYSLDLDAGVWTLVSEDPDVDAYTSSQPWLVDPEAQRTIAISPGQLISLHLEGDRAGSQTASALEGTPGIRHMVTAAALPDGRIVATDRSGQLAVLSTAGVPTWSLLGDAVIPYDYSAEGTLVYDSLGGSLLLVGGARTHSDPGTGEVHRIALDGTSVERLETTGVLPPRSHAAVIADTQKVYVAGGWVAGAIEAAAHDDVWELDLGSLAWRQIATVPVGRAGMGALIVAGELWLIGGRDASGASTLEGTPRVDAVDLATGAVREVPIVGAWPARNGVFFGSAPLGDAFFAFDIVDDTIDGNAAIPWLLEPDGAGGAAWTEHGSCLTDGLVADTVGVSVGPDQVWAIGEHVLSIGR